MLSPRAGFKLLVATTIASSLAGAACKKDTPNRSLQDQLDLVPEGAQGYLVVRDLKAAFDQLRAFKHTITVLQRDGMGPIEHQLKNDPNTKNLDIDVAEMKEGGAKAVASIDAILSSGIDPGKGLVLGGTGASSFVLVGASDLEPLKRIAVAMGENPTEVDRMCRKLESPSGFVGCAQNGKQALDDLKPGKKGKELLAALTESGPVTTDDLVAGRFPVGVDSVTAGVSYDGKAWHLRSSGPPVQGLEVLAPGSATALRDAIPGSPALWARFDRDITNSRVGALVPAVAKAMVDALTGEVSFSAIGDMSFAFRAGVSDPSPFEGLLLLGIPLVTPSLKDPTVLSALQMSSIELKQEKVEAGDRTITVAHAKLSGSKIADAVAMGQKPELTVFAGGGYVTANFGGGLEAVKTQATNTDTAPSKGWLETVPPALARDLAANRVVGLVHLTLEKWVNMELPESSAQDPEARKAQEQFLKAWRSASAPYGPLTMWMSKDESKATVHVIVPTLSYETATSE